MEALQLVIHAERKEMDLAYLGFDWFNGKYLMQNIPVITQLNVLEREGLPRQLLSGWISVCLGEGFSENSHEHLLMDVAFWGLGCYSERVVHTSAAPESPGVFANHSSLGPLNRSRESQTVQENESLQRREMWNGEERIVNIYLHQSLSCITYIKKARSKVRTRICKVLKDKHCSSLYPL